MVCFNCDEEGHISSQCKKPKKAQASGKVFALTGTQIVNEDRLIRGTCFFNSTPLIAIIDTGATHCFIAADCAYMLGLVMSSMNGEMVVQISSLDAQDIAQNNLQDWLKGVVNNLQEVRVSRTQVKTQLCIKGRNASDVIPSYVHPKELDLTWLNYINLKQTSTELELVQRNSELEKENKQLKKELLEQKLLLLEYKTST